MNILSNPNSVTTAVVLMSVGVTHIPRIHTLTYIIYNNPKDFAERPAKKGPAPVFLFLLSMEFFHAPVRLRMLEVKSKGTRRRIPHWGHQKNMWDAGGRHQKSMHLPLYSSPHTLLERTHTKGHHSASHTPPGWDRLHTHAKDWALRHQYTHNSHQIGAQFISNTSQYTLMVDLDTQHQLYTQREPKK